jgi:hypothetical protein
MTTVQWLDYTPASLAPSGSLPVAEQSQINAQEAKRRSALNKLELAINAAEDLERQLGLKECWTHDHPDYQEAAAYIKNKRFIRAVEHLEGLVVARLFELAKANLMGTCAYLFGFFLLY